jgi:hypothetical protein
MASIAESGEGGLDDNEGDTIELIASSSSVIQKRHAADVLGGGGGGDDDDEKDEEMKKPAATTGGKKKGFHNNGWHGGAELDDVFEGKRRKMCDECNFAPPLRSHHCKECKKCVATFDHHCYFIGTCIGERNHCRFWWYLSFQLAVFIVAVSIVNSGHTKSRALAAGDNWVDKNMMVIVSSFFLWPLLAFNGMMWLIHSWLALTNSTSFEMGAGVEHVDYLKGTKECDLPFSKVRNRLSFATLLSFLFSILCAALPFILASCCRLYLRPLL